MLKESFPHEIAEDELTVASSLGYAEQIDPSC